MPSSRHSSLFLCIVLLASNQTFRLFSSLSCKICNSVTLHKVKGLAFCQPAPTCMALFQAKGRELEPAFLTWKYVDIN